VTQPNHDHRIARAKELVAPFRDLYPFAHHFLEAEPGRPGTAQHYIDEGPRDGTPDGPVLLCVHGNPSWSLLYRRLVNELSPRMRCVVPDHLGCGLSDQPTPEHFGYRLEDHVTQLSRLIETLDLRRITLVVHDWGGPIGTLAALRNLDRIERLVITNTSLFPSTRIPLRIAVCRGPLGRAVVEGCNAFARCATHMAVERPMGRDLRRAYVAPTAGSRSARATWRFVDDIPLAPRHPSYATLQGVATGLPRLAHLPTLLLWGERDWCFSPAFRDELARRMPWAERVDLSGAGHYLFEDDPAGVRAALGDFLP
jgi:cis-3-alkyl-4-acyloxetan-2-one decarboxylase